MSGILKQLNLYFSDLSACSVENGLDEDLGGSRATTTPQIVKVGIRARENHGLEWSSNVGHGAKWCHLQNISKKMQQNQAKHSKGKGRKGRA